MLSLFMSTAYAQAAGGVAAKPSLLETIFPFLAIMVFFYFFLGRPQQKKAREHQGFLAAMKRGDQVVTTGGIYGEITGLTEKFVTLEVADNVRIKVVKTQIAGPIKEGNP